MAEKVEEFRKYCHQKGVKVIYEIPDLAFLKASLVQDLVYLKKEQSAAYYFIDGEYVKGFVLKLQSECDGSDMGKVWQYLTPEKKEEYLAFKREQKGHTVYGYNTARPGQEDLSKWYLANCPCVRLVNHLTGPTIF